VITHMLPCHAQHDTARGTSKKCVLQVQCDVFLQWLRRILKQAPLGDCMVGGLGRHISHLSSGFLIQGCMWCAVGLMFGYPWPFGEFNVQYRRLPLPVWPGEEQSRETSMVEACAEGLGRCTTGREKEWLWMRSGRKKQASRRSVRRIRKCFLGWICGSWKGRFGGLGIEQ